MKIKRTQMNLQPSSEMFLVICEIVKVVIKAYDQSIQNPIYTSRAVAEVTFRRKDNGKLLIRRVDRERMIEFAQLRPGIWNSKYLTIELRKLQQSFCVLCLDGDLALLGIFGVGDCGFPQKNLSCQSYAHLDQE